MAVPLTKLPVLLQSCKALAALSPASQSEAPAVPPIETSPGTAACQMAGLGLSEEAAAGTCPETPAATPSLQQDEPTCPPTVPIAPASPAAEPGVSTVAAASIEQSATRNTPCIDATANNFAHTAAAAAIETPSALQLPAQQPAEPAGGLAADSAQQPEAPAVATRCPPLSLVIVPPNSTPEVGWCMLWHTVLQDSDSGKLRAYHGR